MVQCLCHIHAGVAAGCGGLAWNVTPGLPSAFGARYILNIWFPAPFASSNGSSNSSDGPQRFVLLPAGGNSSASSNSTVGEVQAVTGSDGKPLLQQSLTDMQAIVAIEPRRFFANISATNDYSFADTPVLGPPAGTNSSAGDGGQLVRRRREPNSRMPAYVSQKLAWGSPPVGGRMVSGDPVLLPAQTINYGQGHLPSHATTAGSEE
jgi:hypothetical protein